MNNALCDGVTSGDQVYEFRLDKDNDIQLSFRPLGLKFFRSTLRQIQLFPPPNRSVFSANLFFGVVRLIPLN